MVSVVVSTAFTLCSLLRYHHKGITLPVFTYNADAVVMEPVLANDAL